MQKLNDEGVEVDVPYEPELLSFEHEDMDIRNPFLSPCGRFEVDPAEAYGFTESWTGGGCKALDKALPDGGYIRLTDGDGIHLPGPDDIESALIGRYDADGQLVACAEMSEVLLANEMGAEARSVPSSRGPRM